MSSIRSANFCSNWITLHSNWQGEPVFASNYTLFVNCSFTVLYLIFPNNRNANGAGVYVNFSNRTIVAK